MWKHQHHPHVATPVIAELEEHNNGDGFCLSQNHQARLGGSSGGGSGWCEANKNLSEASSGDHDGDLSSSSSSHYTSHHHLHRPQGPYLWHYIPSCLIFNNADDTANVEATALMISTYGRACLGMASLFLGPALLELAQQQATATSDGGCTTQQQQEVEQECTVYGFRPSSLLTNLAAISGLGSAILLPYAGALVDHTPHRRAVGAYAGLALVFVKGVEVLVSSRTWLFITGLQVVSALLFYVHLVAFYAYVSEQSKCPQRQAHFNATLGIVKYVATLIYMLQVIGISTVLGVGDVGTARIGQTLSVITAGPTLYLAWQQDWLPDRPAQRPIPANQSLCTAGGLQLRRTLLQLLQERHRRPLLYLLCSIACGEAASGALVSVSTTYMKNVLRMNANQIGLVFLAVLLGGIPGSKLGSFLTAVLHSPVHSLVLCNIGYIVTTGAAAMVLKGPNDVNFSYLMGAGWGLLLGWQIPLHTAAIVPLVAPLTPSSFHDDGSVNRNNNNNGIGDDHRVGGESEFMGLYLLAGQVLSWLPPAIFSVLNEAGFPMELGLASLCLFFAVALLFLLCLGDYQQAVLASGTATFTAVPLVQDDSVERMQHRNCCSNNSNNNNNNNNNNHPGNLELHSGIIAHNYRSSNVAEGFAENKNGNWS